MSSPERRRRILRQHVETDRLLGVDAVPLGESAGSPAVETPAGEAASPVAETLLAAAAPSARRPEARETKIQQLAALDQDQVKPCTQCDLCRSRTQTVFGDGDVDAPVMFVGEGPGQREDEMGKPFVGRAGELLNKQITAMGFKREQVYIANIVKCRPPNNRTPTPDEVRACSGYLQRQIMIILPKVIVSLGGAAAKFLLNTRQGITAIRGQWHQYEGLVPQGPVIPVMPTFHPAFLLRQYTTDNRKKVWSDLQAAMSLLRE